MKRLLVLTLIISAVFMLPACSEEEEYDMTAFIDQDMIPYFLTFQEEAGKRNVTVDFENSGITALFNPIDGSIAGQCTSQADGLREIIVDKPYWRRADNLERELVIFHELGHCYLRRDHLDTKDTNGTCVSLMNSGLGNCRSNYTYLTREEYLDELFAQ